MATKAVTLRLGSQTTYRYSIDTYDSTKLGLGPLMTQFAGLGEDAFAGPLPITVARPFEQNVVIPGIFPWAMQWQNNTAGEIDWVFLADAVTASTTRRISMYLFNRRTAVWTWQGCITATPPSGTNHTVRGFVMTYDLETTGTVAVSGTAVTGTSTLFRTNKVCAGNRIGFGSTDPTQITVWYEIASIASDTSITLVATAGTVSAGASYVIEDLRAVFTTTASTSTNGGLFVVKGLQIATFTSLTTTGTTIAAATITDSIRATFWLADAAVVTNTAPLGLDVVAKTSTTSQMAYVLDTVSTAPKVYKYNIRAALTLTAGKDTTTLQFKTGAASPALTGTPSQSNNGRVLTLGHGSHSGTSTLYFTTASNVYAAPLNNVHFASADTAWQSSGGTTASEVPPGGTSTFAASGALNALDYLSNIDKLVVTPLTSTTPFRSYISAYTSSGSTQWDRVFGLDNRQIDQTIADNSVTPVPSLLGNAYTTYSVAGLTYVSIATNNATGAATNRLYALPLGADWEYSTTSNSCIILPAMATTDAVKFTNVFVNEVQVLGVKGNTMTNLGLNTEPLRVSYRTSGITDNSGSWTLLDSTGIFSQTGTTSIQLKLEFRTIGLTCIPARVNAITVLYEDGSTDSHYQPSTANSNITSSIFAWRFSTAFGGTVPTLRIRLFNAVTGASLVDDTTAAHASGTFEKSTNNGSSWSAYDTTDKTNEITYIRYTPSSPSSGIKVRALLTLS